MFRPRWIGYRRNAVLNWRTVVEGGRVLLSLLCLKECADVEDGARIEPKAVPALAADKITGPDVALSTYWVAG